MIMMMMMMMSLGERRPVCAQKHDVTPCDTRLELQTSPQVRLLSLPVLSDESELCDEHQMRNAFSKGFTKAMCPCPPHLPVPSCIPVVIDASDRQSQPFSLAFAASIPQQVQCPVMLTFSFCCNMNLARLEGTVRPTQECEHQQHRPWSS